MTTSDEYSVGSVLYPGIKQIVSFSYSRSHGITPDVCQIRMAPQSLDPTAVDYVPIDVDGYVLIEFITYRTTMTDSGPVTAKLGTLEILMQGCRADKASVRKSASSEEWTIPIYDRRWKWKFGSFSGHWNIKKNGVIEKRKEKTARQLADLCLDAMGETKYDTSALDQLEKDTGLAYRKKVRPEVHWDRIPPAQALNDLVTPLGYRVCLGWDDIVRIEKYGEGAYLPTEDLMTAGFDAEHPETPDSVTILGGISMHEAMWELEPVGLDLDGDWRPIDHLSYRPYGGWEYDAPPDFPQVRSKFDEIKFDTQPSDDEYKKRKEQHALAVQTVYRCYRLKYPVGTKEDSTLRDKYDNLGRRMEIKVDQGGRPGDRDYDDLLEKYEAARRELFEKSEPVIPGPQRKNPRTGRLGDYKLTEFEQVLPCFETRAELAVDSYTGKLIRRPPQVTGRYYDRLKGDVTVAIDEQLTSEIGVEVIPDLGIIRFSVPMVRYQSVEGRNGDSDTRALRPADLRVKIATPLKSVYGEPARYTFTLATEPRYRTKAAKLPGGLKNRPVKVPDGTDTKAVIKNEIVQAYQAQYEVAKNAQGEEFIKLTGVLDNVNTEELDKQALQALDVEYLRIIQQDSGSGVYAGLKKINLDGAIQQVAIQLTESSGMTTTVSRNTEVNIYVPDYDERLRNLALKEIIQMHNDTIDNTQQVDPGGS